QRLTMRRFGTLVFFCAVTLISGRFPSAATSTPFTGTALSLPGTVRTSDFDNGGEGVAYHDTTSGNKGGVYRPTDVDLESCVEGGYDVAWTRVGEWLNYTVQVATAGPYTATFRVASLGQGGTFHLEINGVDVTGAIGVPDTGGWQGWQNVTRTVTLSGGTQIARLVFDAVGPTGSIGNFASMTFAAAAPPAPTGGSTPFSGTPVSLPGTIQVEDSDRGGEGVAYHDPTAGNSLGAYRSTSVDIEASTSGGYDVGKVKPGEWLNYSVNVTTSGAYRINVRVASLG